MPRHSTDPRKNLKDDRIRWKKAEDYLFGQVNRSAIRHLAREAANALEELENRGVITSDDAGRFNKATLIARSLADGRRLEAVHAYLRALDAPGDPREALERLKQAVGYPLPMKG